MSIVTAVRDLDRLRQISRVLMRHGFGELAARIGLPGAEARGPETQTTSQLGPRFRLVLQELGTTFVKLGQVISTRPDLVPEPIVTELKRLQDDVAPFEEALARAQIEEGLGAPVETVYASFDWVPLACASVAQVYRATLRGPEGEPVPVVVKVQRPGIDRTIERDISLLYTLARLVERAVPEARVYSPTGLVREFETSMLAELDFTLEANNAERFAENFRGQDAIRFPRIHREASSRRVLTMEFIDGVKVTDAVRLGADGAHIAETAVGIILKMVFEDGFFHADPHPGNMLIVPRPRGERYEPGEAVHIALLDLGLVGRLSPELRDRTVDLLVAAARQDGDALANAMLAIGRPRKRIDEAAFRAHVSRIAERHLGRPLAEMEASAIMRDVVSGALQFDIEVPAELTMLLRAIMTIEGVGKEIHPELDVLTVARPYLLGLVWQRYNPMRIGRDLLQSAGRASAAAGALPGQLLGILSDLQRGELAFRVEDRARAQAIQQQSRRLRMALLGSALLGSGTALVVADRLPGLGGALMGLAVLWFGGHVALEWIRGR
ncbi:MAG: AarF/ABC1/UbiB kinase family protein [Deltaproteobacteria bacterium]|nr:AarF/ABC1/UbiB kinase family protein [Deltaproteobacteria bacterium]MCB9785277.1 AarF/ABC1/UbiB kinase family protein [Deltaproteobacteria bacterium]